MMTVGIAKLKLTLSILLMCSALPALAQPRENWALIVVLDDAPPFVREGFATREACLAFAVEVAGNIRARSGAASAARMATQSSCFLRSR